MTSCTVSASPGPRSVMELINGFQTAQAIHVFVVLGVPDLLLDGGLTSSKLASLTGSHPESLYRLLRALAAIGILHESERRQFSLTPLGKDLASGIESSRSNWAKFAARSPLWAAWGHLLHSVRTGETGFRHVHGQDVWDFRADNPEECAAFDLAMREASTIIARELLSAYDFTRFDHIVDVGGGNGALIAGLLAGCPQGTGMLFDQAHVVATASELLGRAGVRERCKIIAGSFFERLPAGGDAYLLKNILHDWDDADALHILRSCRQAMNPGARLLIVERMLAPPNEGAEGKLSDLNMLVNAGGRERTREEFAALLLDTGFEMYAVIALPTSRFVIEAIPSGS